MKGRLRVGVRREAAEPLLAEDRLRAEVGDDPLRDEISEAQERERDSDHSDGDLPTLFTQYTRLRHPQQQ